MTPQEEFESTRWKLAEDMTDRDVEVLLANKDKLNDEEKQAFSHILTDNTPLPENPLEAAINEAVDDQPAEEPEETPVAPVVATPVAPTIPVITQDELNNYMEEKKKEWDAQGKSQTEQKEEKAKVEKLFEEGYTPNDWDQFSKDYLEKVAPIIEKRIMDRLDAQNAEREKAQNEIKQTAQKIYEGFETEFKDLAAKNLIPVPSDPTYKDIHDSIIAIGDKYGRKNINEAYELWAMIPKEKGGGLDYQADPKNAEKERINRQKAAAGRIGSAAGTATPVKKSNDWKTIHTSSMEDLIDARLQR